MNTIKIYLAESGRIADLRKDFPLYQGSYQNKLLNVLVPTSILAPQFISQTDGVTTAEYVASTAIEIGMTYIARDGSIKVSQNRYMRFLKTLTYQNVEYALYERKLPKEFTLYAGQGANAPQLIINVVNVQTDTTPPQVLSVITSQTCSLDVLPSTNLDTDEAIEPTEMEVVNARLNAIDEILPNKQDKTDPRLNTTDKTVVGGINELKATSDEHTTQIGGNTAQIAINTTDIANLKQNISMGENYIGNLIGNSLPTNEQLNQFVLDNTDPSRQPQNGDTIIFILEIPNTTDKNYKYIYSATGWRGYEIPPMELAGNGTAGILQGTYAVGDTNDTLVDIAGGRILNIYVKDTTNVYRNIREYANSLNTTIQNIIDGNTAVGLSMKSLQDGLGNNIVNTYLTQNAGATKLFVQEYALPREFNDIYFISADGYSKEIPTTPDNGIQFSVTTSAVGDFTLFDISKENGSQFELSSKNSSQNAIYVSASADCTVQFRLTTQVKQTGSDWQDLSIELSNEEILTAGSITKIEFNSAFTSLGNQVLKLLETDQTRQILEVITQDSSAITFDIYSNTTYPSTYNINTQTVVIAMTEGNLGEQPSIIANGTLQENVITFSISNASILNNNTECEFILRYADTTEIAPTTELQLSLGTLAIRLATPYNYTSGNATMQSLSQVMKTYDPVYGTTINFKGFVKISAGGEISVLVDEDNLNGFATTQQLNEGLYNYIGREQQVDFNATLENNQIISTLDDSIADFTFTSGTGYLIHIYLPLVTVTGDLDNSYPILLKDASGNTININSIFETRLGENSTVGDLCQIQNYDVGIGYSWLFYGHYKEVNNGGIITRSIYTADVSRDTNPSMTGQDFHVGIINTKLKVGTTVKVTSDYSVNGYNYYQGHSYLVTGQFVDGDLILDTLDLTQLIFTKKEVIISAPTEATQGTIEQEQLDILQDDDSNYIFLNGQIYTLANNRSGYLTYTHTSQDNTDDFVVKCLTITISTLAWTLTETTIADKTETDNKIAQLSNPNLLINGDFRINQRGQTNYTGTGSTLTYSVDRWALRGTTSFNANTKTFSCVNPNVSYSQINQTLENYTSLIGKTVTLSIKVSNVNYISGSPRIVIGYGSNSIASNVITSDGVYVITTNIPSSATKLAVSLANWSTDLTSNWSMNIEYMKLELGNIATPFSPRPYAEELTMCQRYYWKKGSNNPYGHIVFGMMTSATQFRGQIYFPTSMRLQVPTINAFGSFAVNANAGAVVGASAVDFQSGWYSGVNIIVNTTRSLTDRASAYFGAENDSSAYIEFDAEIY